VVTARGGLPTKPFSLGNQSPKLTTSRATTLTPGSHALLARGPMAGVFRPDPLSEAWLSASHPAGPRGARKHCPARLHAFRWPKATQCHISSSGPVHPCPSALTSHLRRATCACQAVSLPIGWKAAGPGRTARPYTRQKPSRDGCESPPSTRQVMAGLENSVDRMGCRAGQFRRRSEYNGGREVL